MRSNRKTLRRVAIVAAVAALALGAAITSRAAQDGAADAAPAGELPIVVETRTYEVASIVAEHPLAKTLRLEEVASRATPGGGGSLFGGDAAALGGFDPDATSDERLIAIISIIQGAVDSETWKDNGGDVGSITAIHGTLVVTHTKATLAKVEELLAKLRRGPAPLVLDVRFVSMSPADMERDSELRDGVRVLKGSAPSGDQVIGRVEVSAFSGDPIRAASGEKTAYVSDFEPVVANVAGYDPTVSELETGVGVQGVAYVISDSEARLDLRAAHRQLIAMNSVSVVVGDEVQTPVVREKAFTSRVVVPLNQPVVIGSATADVGTTRPSDGNQCYLVVTVTSAAKR